MAVTIRKEIRGYLALLGGFLVQCSLGSLYSYGNMAPYLTSYVRERSRPENLGDQLSVAIFAINMSVVALFIPIGGLIVNRLGYRLTSLLGGCTMSAGVMLSYFAIQSSFYTLLVTFGAMVGVGIGTGYMSALICAMKWFPKYTGRVNGAVMVGFGGSPLIFNVIQTAYINPNNLPPNGSLNTSDTDAKYFDDADILDRVPSSFLVLGAIYLALILIGVMLQFDPPDDDTDNQNENKELTSLLNDMKTDEHNDAVFEDDDPKTKDLHPREVLKKWSFWNMWGTFTCLSLLVIFIPSLYKTYGQTFISDDKFLARAGAISGIFNAVGRLLWGVLADFTSYRTTTLAMCALTTVFSLSLMAASLGGKIAFLICICALFFLIGGSLTLFSTGATWAYGIKHVGVNFGLMLSGLAIVGPVGIILPIVLEGLLGWNALFMIIAVASAIGFLLTFKFNARRADGRIV